MGFRFKRFDYVGGVAPMSGLPFVDNPSAAVARSQALCKDFADFIISCNKGWSLDTSRNATTSDFVSVPVWNTSKVIQSYSFPGLFFTNTNGCKLFLAVIGTTSNYGIALEPTNFARDYIDSNYLQMLTGTIFSMIPAGSSNSFGSDFDNSFLPSDATLLRGTVNVQNEGSAWWFTPTCFASNGTVYSYGLFVDSHCVGISGSIAPSGTPVTLNPGFWCGRIIGTLAHEESTNIAAQYGTLSLSFSYYINSLDQEFYLKPIIDETDNRFDRYGELFKTAINYHYESENKWKSMWDNFGSITKSDGTRLTPAGGNTRFMSDVSNIMDSKVTSSAIGGATRWVPYMVSICTNNLSANGIVPGDGFKGYLDTNLFRCGIVTLNQLYANGTFCGWNNMLMIGWDPNNTDTL